jgi:transposase
MRDWQRRREELLQIKDARLTITLQAIVSAASYMLKTTA